LRPASLHTSLTAVLQRDLGSGRAIAGRLNARPERPDLFIKNLTGIASLALLPLAFCKNKPKGPPADSWREPTQSEDL